MTERIRQIMRENEERLRVNAEYIAGQIKKYGYFGTKYKQLPDAPSSSFARRPKHLQKKRKSVQPDFWLIAHDLADRIHLDALLLHRHHDLGDVLDLVKQRHKDINDDDAIRLALMTTGILLKKPNPRLVPDEMMGALS